MQSLQTMYDADSMNSKNTLLSRLGHSLPSNRSINRSFFSNTSHHEKIIVLKSILNSISTKINSMWLQVIPYLESLWHLDNVKKNIHYGLRWFSIRPKIYPCWKWSLFKQSEVKKENSKLQLNTGGYILQNGYKIYWFEIIWKKNAKIL